MSRLQVLAFIDWYEPFFKAGGPVRSMLNLADHLQGKVDLHIVTGDREYMGTTSTLELPTDEWITRSKGERVLYASSAGRGMARWRGILRERKWDVVYINGMYSRWSTIVPLWLLRGSTQRRIVAVRGMLAEGAMGQSRFKKRVFLWLMKAFGCFKGVEFQATNEGEVEDIRRWIGTDARVHLVPNLGRPFTASVPRPVEKRVGELRLMSVARIAMEKNTLFAIQRLKEVRGQVTLDLHGTVYDPDYWRKCETAIAQLPTNVRVQWHGPLPSEQVAEVLAGGHALFMPSVGENFGHAVLESLSVGRPVLISDRTPWRDLEQAQAGWDLPLGTPERFEQVLNELVGMDQEHYDMFAQGAFRMAQRSLYDPSAVEKNLAMFSI